MIVREVFPNGVRLITEQMDHVRSVSVGVWLTRGSRHEPREHGGIAHFVEHMLFKGTTSRSAEDIAQQVDSLGGHLDAFTSKEYAGYYIKVLDEHLPTALDVLSDLVLNPAFDPEDIEREKKVILEEIKMVEDTPDDLVHELFTQSFWRDHPLGQPILGTADSVQALTPRRAPVVFRRHLYRAQLRDRRRRQHHARADARAGGADVRRPRRRWATRRRNVPPAVVRARAGARQGSGAEPRAARHQFLSAESRRPVRGLRAQHDAGRLDELAAVPERAREARAGVRRLQQPGGLPRCRSAHRLRRLRQRRRRRAGEGRRRRVARHEAAPAGRPSCGARRIT